MFSYTRKCIFVRFLINKPKHITTSTTWSEIFQVQSQEEFEKKVKNSIKPVIVDFFATWCNPCKLLAPRIESVIDEKAGAINLAKVDIDEHSDLALNYNISSVPVLLVIRNGKVRHRLVGLQDVDKLRLWVDEVVKDEP